MFRYRVGAGGWGPKACFPLRNANGHQALLGPYSLMQKTRWLTVLILSMLITACTPALHLPDDFWQLLAKADLDGQRAQSAGREIAIMNLQRIAYLKSDAKPDLQKLLDWTYDEQLPDPPPPTSNPPNPPGSSDKEKQAKYRFDYRVWQLQYAVEQYKFFQDRSTTAEAYVSDLRRLPLGAFLSDKDFLPVVNAYEQARTEWNALYDTSIVIIGTDRNIPDWPDFAAAVKEADRRAQAIFPVHQTALDKTSSIRTAILEAADRKLSRVRQRRDTARQAVIEAMKRISPGPAITGFTEALKIVNTKDTGGKSSSGDSSQGFQWIGSPLFAGGIDLVALFKEVGQIHERERAFLQCELRARKWPPLECLADPKNCGLPQSGSREEPKSPIQNGKIAVSVSVTQAESATTSSPKSSQCTYK